MLYRMLTGEYPFPEGKGKWSAEAATPRKLEVPGAPELAELVERMLHRVPKGRPRDGAAVLAELAPIDDRLRARPADGKPPERARRRKASFGDLLAEPKRRHTLRTVVGYGVLVLALAGAGTAGWKAWKGSTIEPARDATDSRPMVAVADFANETGEKELDSVSGLLITSLEQSRSLRVLTRSRMFDVLHQLGKGDQPRIDESLAREVGRKVGAQAILLAAIRRAGDGYVVDLHAVDPSRDEYLFTVRERAAGKAAVFDLVDRVAAASRARLVGVVGTPHVAAGTGVAALTTGDMRAWDLFSRARQAIDRLRFQEAHELLGEAIGIDPEFALAHYQRAMLFQWRVPDAATSLADHGRYGEALSRAALQRADRLPEKERLLLRSFEAYRDGPVVEAMRIRRQVADAYPLDKEAQFLAGHVLVGTFERSAAIPYLQRALQLDPSYAIAKLYLAVALGSSGQAVRHVEWLRQEARGATDARYGKELASALLVAGEEGEAMALLQRMRGASGDSPLPLVAINHLICAGRVGEAAEELAKALEVAQTDRAGEPQREQPFNRNGHVSLLLALGRVGEARRVLEEGASNRLSLLGALKLAAVEGSPEGLRAAATAMEAVASWPFLDGVLAQYAAPILAHAGDAEAAGRLAAATQANPNRPGYDPTSSTLLLALEAWGRGDRAKAREGFATLAGHADGDVRYLGQLLTGDLAFAGGDCPGAITALEGARAIRWTTAMGGPWTWSITGVLRKLAACYEKTGDLARARERNDELLRRWAVADPDLPALVEARATRDRIRQATP